MQAWPGQGAAEHSRAQGGRGACGESAYRSSAQATRHAVQTKGVPCPAPVSTAPPLSPPSLLPLSSLSPPSLLPISSLCLASGPRRLPVLSRAVLSSLMLTPPRPATRADCSFVSPSFQRRPGPPSPRRLSGGVRAQGALQPSPRPPSRAEPSEQFFVLRPHARLNGFTGTAGGQKQPSLAPSLARSLCSLGVALYSCVAAPVLRVPPKPFKPQRCVSRAFLPAFFPPLRSQRGA